MAQAFGPAILLQEDLTEDEATEGGNSGEPPAKKARGAKKK